MYDLKFNEAIEILKSYNFKKVDFYSCKKLKINGKVFFFENKNKIYKEILALDLIITFPSPKMTYETYLKNIKYEVVDYKKKKLGNKIY